MNETGEIPLRDWLAAHCPQWWMDDATPKTLGETRDAIVAHGILPRPRSTDVIHSYTDADRRRLRIALTYDYADAMLAARKATP